MNYYQWREKGRYRQAVVILTMISLVLLAAHPELRLLVPLVDSLGLDLLLLLVGSQLMASVRPIVQVAYTAVVLPAARAAGRVLIYFLGSAGPPVAARVAVGGRGRLAAVYPNPQGRLD